MADLVRGDFDNELAHQLLLHGGRQRAARFEHADAEGRLLRQAVGVIAVTAAAAVVPPTRQVHLRRLRRRKYRRDELFTGPAHGANDAFAESDVGIVNLAGEGIRPRRADGERRVHTGEPANRIVTRVGRVPVGVVRHLSDDEGVLEADFFEGLIPEQRAFLDPVAVFERDRVFEPEHDGFFGRRQFRGRVRLFQLPTMNVAHIGRTGMVRSEILLHVEEIAHAVVRAARFVSGPFER